ncbi:LolA family protein [Cochleicola gelatinilyticus]|uniref:Cell envelope biogenesis protein LolA n=1 Tax=Cochleicola gelatinilyticus TaxID=1763537 RepID=A0A167JCC7_9FLAO|nr:outer membrane lipoprotein carrier protein LolA [Cochleicola gelatinilyticus]OAB80536.1 cell envelope biogenesis protein LolA [Cochleicola gelatinilyticus]
MRNYIILLLFIGVYSASAQRPLSALEAKEFKQKVIKSAEQTETIVSDFTQYKHLSFLNNEIKTEGKLVFKAPNFIKWEYIEPYQYSAIFKNDKLYVDDSGTKSDIDLGANKTFRNFNSLIVNSIKGDMFNESQFDITFFSTQDEYLVKFIPKDTNIREYIAIFELTFTKENPDVTSVKMIEPSEDFTRIVFKNKKLNTTVSHAVFNH